MTISYVSRTTWLQKETIKLFLLLFLAIQISSCSSDSNANSNQKITIAAAGNLAPLTAELGACFKSETGIDCDFVNGSSGKLCAQIENGAPYDILLAADMDYPQRLYENGLCFAPPQVYATGQLIIWAESKENLDLAKLTSQNISKIGIANIKTAPYGTAAYKFLQKRGLWNQLEPKFVYGENISQVNMYIELDNVQVAFTSSSALNGPLKGRGHWRPIIDNEDCRIPQGMVLLKNGNHPTANTELFQKFICGDKAQKIFEKYGYLLPEE